MTFLGSLCLTISTHSCILDAGETNPLNLSFETRSAKVLRIWEIKKFYKNERHCDRINKFEVECGQRMTKFTPNLASFQNLDKGNFMYTIPYVLRVTFMIWT